MILQLAWLSPMIQNSIIMPTTSVIGAVLLGMYGRRKQHFQCVKNRVLR